MVVALALGVVELEETGIVASSGSGDSSRGLKFATASLFEMVAVVGVNQPPSMLQVAEHLANLGDAFSDPSTDLSVRQILAGVVPKIYKCLGSTLAGKKKTTKESGEGVFDLKIFLGKRKCIWTGGGFMVPENVAFKSPAKSSKYPKNIP